MSEKTVIKLVIFLAAILVAKKFVFADAIGEAVIL